MMKNWLGWSVILALAIVTGLLLLLGLDIDGLPDHDRRALADVAIFVSFGSTGLGIYRVLYGDRPWHRRVQAWSARPVTQWNDWRIIGLLAGIAFGFYFLGISDLPADDKWTSASVLVLLAVCLAAQMIGIALFRKRGRK
jgi:hypothetical protein